MLTDVERKRYDRQIMIKEIGEDGQEKLKNAKVVIAGAGGLGSPISIYLTSAGVGRIQIIDHDIVELSNLNRQVLHWEDDIGRYKVDSAKDKLKKINRGVKIETVCEKITEENISRLLNGFDVIVDAMDNLSTRYIINRFAIRNNIPFFHGAVNGFEGRAMTIIPGKTACLRCMYRGDILQEKFPVIGVTPGIIGMIQATEVIKYLLGIGNLLINKLLLFNGLEMSFIEFIIHKNPDCDHCGSNSKKE